MKHRVRCVLGAAGFLVGQTLVFGPSPYAGATLDPGAGTARRPAASSGRKLPMPPRPEFRFERRSGGSFATPGWIRSMQGRIETGGLALRTPRGNGRDAGLQLRLDRFGREGSETGVAHGRLFEAENRIEIRRTGLVEWFRFDERGIEQGFDIAGPAPSGGAGRPLVLEMAVDGDRSASMLPDGAGVEFAGPEGGERILYSGLRVTDATGRVLSAELDAPPERLRILVQDEGATYPLTVDPLMTSPSWSNDFGYQVASAGDVNGDGFGDFLVSGIGLTLIYHGAAGSPADSPVRVFDNAATAAGAGDVNGDGFDDVILSGNGARLFLGGPLGLSPSPAWDDDGALYLAVAGAGDVNGDGFDDLLVGARVFHGSPTGPGDAPNWTGTPSGSGTGFGSAVAGAGDVNGDGYDDILVGEPAFSIVSPDVAFTGRVLLYPGSASGISDSALWEKTRSITKDHFGTVVAGAGDLNGDGFADLLVSGDAGSGGPQSGILDVFLGSSTGPHTSPGLEVLGGILEGRLGASLASAGDVDGDGLSDFVVGEPNFGSPEAGDGVGRAFLFRGASAGPGQPAAWSAVGTEPFGSLGTSVAGADVNGDGISDVLVGSFRGVSLYLGMPANHPPVPRPAASPSVECTTAAGGIVHLDGLGSTDPDSTPGTSDDIVLYEWLERGTGPNPIPLGTGPVLDMTLPLGTHRLVLRVTDRDGTAVSGEFTVEVVDTVPPEITPAATPSVIWPPNHRLIPVGIRPQASDACGNPAVVLISVNSNEPDDAPGPFDGFTSDDVQGVMAGTADLMFLVRAERSELGTGRVYTALYRATDEAGNETLQPVEIRVPLFRSGGRPPGQHPRGGHGRHGG